MARGSLPLSTRYRDWKTGNSRYLFVNHHRHLASHHWRQNAGVDEPLDSWVGDNGVLVSLHNTTVNA